MFAVCPNHGNHCTVRCTVNRLGVIGPYFFENAAGDTATITSNCFVFMLEIFLLLEFRRRRIKPRHVWFQQDGATTNTARIQMQSVCRILLEHAISCFGDMLWPPRFSNLSACDYFLRGYLKAIV